MTDTNCIVVLVACPLGDAADALAKAIVESRLAACVNRLPGVRSTYRWQGKVTCDEEALLMVKSTREAFPALAAFVANHHPYDVPEIVALPVVAGHAPYLDWVESNVDVSHAALTRS
ncbi:divalent-cation tolerance protein CutA [Luteibacter aegosomatis]|uniref:divalent-cation tolerance protein CutA n=1 Tax=Luteibacter aegosomatis TaxID=2911537 RepID=UPI001FFBAD2A|nr:divalent-cation tolerance protein CutA [Luteibacter aegosomatis]UPG85276.1 divalent-cation tolerance protein CutA [Luteibacter aegosomatis]